MTIRTLSLAAVMTVAITGAALAQTPAGGGRSEGNMNNPGSVKSGSDKAMDGRAASMGTDMAPARGTCGGPSTGTAGSAGTGSTGTGGKAATGSGAAPSGK